MPRYFIEVSYKGAGYSGFQVQQNANTIQSEVEKALEICFRKSFSLTGSSRTDAGVHALQNYFHFDSETELTSEALNDPGNEKKMERYLYSLNSILPANIVVQRIALVEDNYHSRFDAVSREYKYQLYQRKNPFYESIAYYYPYRLDISKLREAAAMVKASHDFTSFSKRNTQVKDFNCSIIKSDWFIENDLIIYNVISNRFLRGMVRGLVGTMLQVGSGKISLQRLEEIIRSKDCTKADFSVPPQGLFLIHVAYPFKT